MGESEEERIDNREKRRYYESFLQINVGHILILITMVLSAIWWFVVYDRDISQTKYVVSQLVEAEHVLAGRVESIDNTGTHLSQHNLDKELETIRNTTERIGKLEQFNSELIQRTDKMNWQLTNISEWVQEQKRKERP